MKRLKNFILIPLILVEKVMVSRIFAVVLLLMWYFLHGNTLVTPDDVFRCYGVGY